MGTEKKKIKKAVFLDRDGTLNEDPGYLSDPAQLKLYQGVPEALGRLKKAGFLLIIVSNQSGVGRGLIKKETLPKIHEKLDELLKPFSATIDQYQLCYHRPEDYCECRKPKVLLFQNAQKSLQIDLSSSYMVGDKVSDIIAGQNAGCKATVLVRTGHGQESEKLLNDIEPDVITDGMAEAANWILDQEI